MKEHKTSERFVFDLDRITDTDNREAVERLINKGYTPQDFKKLADYNISPKNAVRELSYQERQYGSNTKPSIDALKIGAQDFQRMLGDDWGD